MFKDNTLVSSVNKENAFFSNASEIVIDEFKTVTTAEVIKLAQNGYISSKAKDLFFNMSTWDREFTCELIAQCYKKTSRTIKRWIEELRQNDLLWTETHGGGRCKVKTIYHLRKRCTKTSNYKMFKNTVSLCQKCHYDSIEQNSDIQDIEVIESAEKAEAIIVTKMSLYIIDESESILTQRLSPEKVKEDVKSDVCLAALKNNQPNSNASTTFFWDNSLFYKSVYDTFQTDTLCDATDMISHKFEIQEWMDLQNQAYEIVASLKESHWDSCKVEWHEPTILSFCVVSLYLGFNRKQIIACFGIGREKAHENAQDNFSKAFMGNAAQIAIDRLKLKIEPIACTFKSHKLWKEGI